MSKEQQNRFALNSVPEHSSKQLSNKKDTWILKKFSGSLRPTSRSKDVTKI